MAQSKDCDSQTPVITLLSLDVNPFIECVFFGFPVSINLVMW